MEIEPEPEPVPQPEPEPEPVGDRLVGRKTPAGVWVGEGAPSALHDELHGMEARKAQLQREIEEMEEAQAKQMATMLQQRSNLKSSMDAMDLQKVAAETAASVTGGAAVSGLWQPEGTGKGFNVGIMSSLACLGLLRVP